MPEVCIYCESKFEPKRAHSFFCDACDQLYQSKKLDRCRICDNWFALNEPHYYICDRCHNDDFREVFTHTRATTFITQGADIFSISHFMGHQEKKLAPCWAYAYHPNGIICECEKCVSPYCSCKLDRYKKVKCLNKPEYDPKQEEELIKKYDMYEEAYNLAKKCEQEFFVKLCPYVKALECPVHKVDFEGEHPKFDRNLNKPLAMCLTCQDNGFCFGDFHSCMGNTPVEWVVDMAICINNASGLSVWALHISHKVYKEYKKYLNYHEIDVY